MWPIKRFSQPEFLKTFSPPFLIDLLRPFERFLEERGMRLPPRSKAGSLDYDQLAETLDSPDEGFPDHLVHALYLTSSFATEAARDHLIEAAKRRRIEIDGERATSADVAAQIWLKAPDLLERRYADEVLAAKRTYHHFQTKTEKPAPAKKPQKRVLRDMESHLRQWFEEHDRGTGCQIRASPAVHDEVWFFIWHGRTMYRAGTAKGGKKSSIAYRPEKYDVVIYNSAIGELRLMTGSGSGADPERQEYLRVFGGYLFGDVDYFPDQNKYTLEPLRLQGTDALLCSDTDGIERAQLSEIRFAWEGGADLAIEIHQAPDVFTALEARGIHGLPTEARLILAKFKVWFSGHPKPRTVTIRPPNVSSYKRDSDSTPVEDWWRRRGFIRPRARRG